MNWAVFGYKSGAAQVGCAVLDVWTVRRRVGCLDCSKSGWSSDDGSKSGECWWCQTHKIRLNNSKQKLHQTRRYAVTITDDAGSIDHGLGPGGAWTHGLAAVFAWSGEVTPWPSCRSWTPVSSPLSNYATFAHLTARLPQFSFRFSWNWEARWTILKREGHSHR